MSEKNRIYFHILQTNSEPRNSYAARLAEKIYRKNSSAFIFTNSLKESQDIDDWLWIYRDTSFLPHHIADEKGTWAPILIGHSLIPEHQQVLINLSASVPDFFLRFEKVIEIVCLTNELKELSRNKYRYYKSLGCQLNTFQINSNK
jgi:DNA polymerase III subunit chi